MKRMSLSIVAAILGAMPVAYAQDMVTSVPSSQSAEFRDSCARSLDAELLRLKVVEDRIRSELAALPSKIACPELDAVHAFAPKVRAANIKGRRAQMKLYFNRLGLSEEQAERAVELSLKAPPNERDPRKIMATVLGRPLTADFLQALSMRTDRHSVDAMQLDSRKQVIEAIQVRAEFGELRRRLWDPSTKVSEQAQRLKKDGLWLYIDDEELDSESGELRVTLMEVDERRPVVALDYPMSDPTMIRIAGVKSLRQHALSNLSRECRNALEQTSATSASVSTASEAKVLAPAFASESVIVKDASQGSALK